MPVRANILKITFNGSIFDAYGNWPTITPTGSPTLDLSHTIAPTGIGTFHPAARYLTIPSFSLGSGDWVIAMDVYVVTLPALGYGVSFFRFGEGSDGDGGVNFSWFRRNDDARNIDVHFAYSSPFMGFSGVSVGAWISVRVEKTGPNVYMAVNGVPGGDFCYVPARDFYTPRTLYIGSGHVTWETAGESDMYIDNIDIYVPGDSVSPTQCVMAG
jgi:hypothetical protein